MPTIKSFNVNESKNRIRNTMYDDEDLIAPHTRVKKFCNTHYATVNHG